MIFLQGKHTFLLLNKFDNLCGWNLKIRYLILNFYRKGILKNLIICSSLICIELGIYDFEEIPIKKSLKRSALILSILTL